MVLEPVLESVTEFQHQRGQEGRPGTTALMINWSYEDLAYIVLVYISGRLRGRVVTGDGARRAGLAG